MPDAYSLEKLTADLARARAEEATDFTDAEKKRVTDGAEDDARLNRTHLGVYSTPTLDALEDLAMCNWRDTRSGERDGGAWANERWRRRQAAARGDDLAANWPEIAGRSDG